MRINARLSDEYTAKMKYLQETTGKSASEIIRDALSHYYASQRQQQRPTASEIFRRNGFIAMAESEPDWSENYKADLDWDDKT